MGTVAALFAAADMIMAGKPGYDQGQRWTFLDRATLTLVAGRELDCSSLCGAIAALAGYLVNLGDPFYTGTFKARLAAAGFTAIRFGKLSDVRPGDFVLGPGHVVFVGADGRWLSAETDEHGKASGGKAGDQTGKEVRWRAPYNRAAGWQWILRPPADPAPVTPKPAPVKVIEFRLVTWNILGRRFDYAKTWATRLTRIIARLRQVLEDGQDAKASILCLTECRAAEAREVAAALGMSWVNYLGSTILYAKSWKLTGKWSRTWRSGTHGAIIAELERDGRTINVVCGHLPPHLTAAATRKACIAKLIADAKGWKDPTILAGDLNCSSKVPAQLLAAGWVNAATAALTKIRADFRTSGTFKKGPAIDHVVGRNRVKFRSMRVLRGWHPATKKAASDHHPVTVQVTV